MARPARGRTRISYGFGTRAGVAPVFAAAVAFLVGVLVTGIVAPHRRDGARTIVGVDGDAHGGSRNAVAAPTPGPSNGEIGMAGSGELGPAGGATDARGGTGSSPGAVAAGGADGSSTSRRGDSSPAPGVGGEVIRLGVAYPDLAYLEAINPAYGSGDIPAQFRASLERWAREGRVPVHGRRVELVFRKFDSLNESDQRSACVELMDEKKVFAVLAPGAFGAGAECVAQQYKAPVLTTAFVNDDFLRRSEPYLFLMHMTTGRLLRNWVHWAHENQHLNGKKIGVYYQRTGANPDADFQTVERELRKLGYEPAVVVSTNNPLGGPEDQVAAQRFRAAGVDLALLMVTVISQQNFMQYADAQRYRPTYIDSDYIWNTDDSVSAPKPGTQYDGTLAMSGYHSGEVGSNRAVDEARTCVADLERHSRAKVRPNYNEWRYLLSACDLVKAAVLALQAAGPDLTRETLIRGIESLKNVPMARHADVTFGPGDHQGVDTQRTVRWHRDCTCWRLAGDGSFSPLWVP